MKRLTERDEFGNADIIALSDMMPELYAELSFAETNALTDALNRLADYEDTGMEPSECEKLRSLYESREAEIRQLKYELEKSEEKSENEREKVKPGGKNTRTAADIYTETEAGRNLLDMIGDWCEAYAEDRLVVLPCKVGDTVYFDTYAPNEYLGIMPHRIGKFLTFAVVKGKWGARTNIEISDFGKSAFLSREEAEAALKKRTQPLVEWVKEDAEQ